MALGVQRCQSTLGRMLVVGSGGWVRWSRSIASGLLRIARALRLAFLAHLPAHLHGLVLGRHGDGLLYYEPRRCAAVG